METSNPALYEILKDNPQLIEASPEAKAVANLVLDMTPLIGDAKGIIEAIAGKDALGQELTPEERLLALMCLSEVKAAAEGAEFTEDIGKFAKKIFDDSKGILEDAVNPKNRKGIEAALEGVGSSEDIIKRIDNSIDDVTDDLYKNNIAKIESNLDTSVIRESPESYFSYKELKKKIKELKLSGRGKGFEAHHLLEKQFADLFGISKNDIISVPLTPKWHRNVGGAGNNIDDLIGKELKKISKGKSYGAKEVWEAHKNVYKKLGQEDWAKAIYEAYVKDKNIPY